MKCCNRFSFRLYVLLFSTSLSFSADAQNIQHGTLNIYFSFNSFSISKKDLQALTAFVHQRMLTNSEGMYITIAGYTDTVGTVQYNDSLSMRRCSAVNKIIEQEINSNKNLHVQLISMGEKNSTGKTDSLDRRVTIAWHNAEIPGKQIAIQLPANTPIKNEGKKTDNKKTIDTVIILGYIYFEPDLPVLTPASVSAFPHYVSILKKYKENEMEVGGHVNHTDSKLKETDPLFKLSEKRAKEVYDYLIDAGFDSSRLTHKGYGNSHLLFPLPGNLEEKMKNMRVEITVFKK